MVHPPLFRVTFRSLVRPWFEWGGGLESPDEADLVERLRRGDTEALGELFRAYGGAMTTLARSMLWDRDQADDVVVSALIRIHEAAPGFRGARGLKTWSMRIVANLCRDELRRRKFSAGRPEDMDPLAAKGLVLEPVDAWDEAMDREAMMARLERALDGLPADQREAIILHDRLELSYHEAAETLGIPVGALKARLFRARAALRRALDATPHRSDEGT